MSAQIVSCEHCDDPIVLGPTGWGRCRLCGYESLRPAFENDLRRVEASAPARAETLGLSLLSTSDKG